MTQIVLVILTLSLALLVGKVIVNMNIYFVILISALLFTLFASLRPNLTMFFILALSLFTGVVKVFLGVRESPLILDAALIMVAFILIINHHILHYRSIGLPRLSKPILLILIISLLQMFNPNIPDMQIALEGFRQSAFYMIAFFIPYYLIREKRHIYWIMVMIVISSVVIGIYGIRQHYFPFQAELDWANTMREHTFWGVSETERTLRVFSTFNSLGAYWIFMPLAIVTNLALFFIAGKNVLKRLILVSLTIIVISTLFGLGRAAWISSVIGIMGLSLFLDKRERTKVLIVSTVILFGGVLFTKIIPGTELIGMRVKTLVNPQEDYNIMFRFAIMKDAIEWILENPFGRGVGMTSSGIITRYGTPNIAGHNQFLDVAIELGVLSMFVYIYIVVIAIWIGIKTARESSDNFIRITAAWLLSYNLAFHAIGMQGQVFGFPQSLYYWFLLGLLVNLRDIEKRALGASWPAFEKM